MAKVREFPEENYRAIYHNGKTLRQKIDDALPILELKYPEFYDISITNKCNGGCPYCYQDSTPSWKHYEDIVKKVSNFFGPMTENQRPFQVAYGGGEPTLHPEFCELLYATGLLGIAPNYTTNGSNLTDEIMRATVGCNSAVAVSCHPHMVDIWESAAMRLYYSGVKVNLHIIISDRESIDRFKHVIYPEFDGVVQYFVLLPYYGAGRAYPKDVDYNYMIASLADVDRSKIAFGSLFHPYLATLGGDWDLSIYPPEIFSKYLCLDNMKLYKSSFNLTEVK